MQAAFGTVIVVVSVLAGVVAIFALLSSGHTWSDFGKGMVMDHDIPRSPPAGSAAAIGERDAEIRAMLDARNARRLRRGEPPLDVEAELARLTAPAPRDEVPQIEESLREEVRQLVIARNNRRIRAGKSPLDIEAELARELKRVAEF
jgi:hypothetical protein